MKEEETPKEMVALIVIKKEEQKDFLLKHNIPDSKYPLRQVTTAIGVTTSV